MSEFKKKIKQAVCDRERAEHEAANAAVKEIEEAKQVSVANCREIVDTLVESGVQSQKLWQKTIVGQKYVGPQSHYVPSGTINRAGYMRDIEGYKYSGSGWTLYQSGFYDGAYVPMTSVGIARDGRLFTFTTLYGDHSSDTGEVVPHGSIAVDFIDDPVWAATVSDLDFMLDKIVYKVQTGEHMLCT